MKFFRKTVFWVIVLAVLAGSFYIIDRETEEKKALEEEKKRLFSFEPEDVTSIVVKKEGEADVTVKRVEESWVLTSPVNAAGDSENVERFLKALVRAKTDAVLFEEPPPGKLEELGLKDPYLKVELKARHGTGKTVHFGDMGPTHNVAYALIEGDPRIFRIHSDVRSDSDKGAYYFRDKTILTFDPLRVKDFKIRWRGGEEILINHPAEGKWDAEGLPPGQTKFVKLMEFLVMLKKGEIKAFASEEPEGLDEFGLDSPRVEIIFTDEDGVRHSLLLGARDKVRRGIFAKRGSEKSVFVLEEEVMDRVPRSLAELEEKPVEVES